MVAIARHGCLASFASRHRTARGFTLIELLVVVAIIALLISILVPSLGAARDSSRRAVCMANLRATGLALNTYAHDNRSQIPDYRRIGHMPFRIRYHGRLSMPIPAGQGGSTMSPYQEVYGITTSLHTGKGPNILPNGLPVITDPPIPIYCPADSKVWICPANPGPANITEWKTYGNTYAYFCNKGNIDPNNPTDYTKASKVYNLDAVASDPDIRRIVWKTPLLWDAFNNYPGPPCTIPTDGWLSSYTVKAENQQRPHKAGAFSFKKSAAGFWVGFYVDGHCQMNAMNKAE